MFLCETIYPHDYLYWIALCHTLSTFLSLPVSVKFFIYVFREKAFQNPIVRQYAIDTLQEAGDEMLLRYLLQLVQALRYEPEGMSSPIHDFSPHYSSFTLLPLLY